MSPTPPGRLVTRKQLLLWPRDQLQAYYNLIGHINSYSSPPERLDDVRAVQLDEDGKEVWIEVTTSQIIVE